MLAGIEENRLKTGKHKLKVKYFPGARTDGMYDYMEALLWKLPDYIILYIETEDAIDNTSREIFEKNIKLKTYIQKGLLKITISTLLFHTMKSLFHTISKSLFQHQLNDTTMGKHH